MAMGTTATGLDFGQLASELADRTNPYSPDYPANQAIAIGDFYKGGTYTPHDYGGKGLTVSYSTSGSYRYVRGRNVSGVFRTYYYWDGSYLGYQDTKTDGLLNGSYYYGAAYYIMGSSGVSYYSIWRAEPWAHASSGQIDLGSFAGQVEANGSIQYNGL